MSLRTSYFSTYLHLYFKSATEECSALGQPSTTSYSTAIINEASTVDVVASAVELNNPSNEIAVVVEVPALASVVSDCIDGGLCSSPSDVQLDVDVMTTDGVTAVFMLSATNESDTSDIGERISPSALLQSTAAPGVIKARKPRRKVDRPLYTAGIQISADISCTVLEPSLGGSKKHHAMEAVKQSMVRSLFKFIPRGSCVTESNSTSRLCKGLKVSRLLSEYSLASMLSSDDCIDSSSSSTLQVENTGPQSMTYCPSSGDASSQYIIGEEMEVVDETNDPLHSFAHTVLDNDKIHRQKVRTKPLEKEEKKRQIAKSDDSTSKLHSYQLLLLAHTKAGHNSAVVSSSGSGSNHIEAADGTGTDHSSGKSSGERETEAVCPIDIAEKIKGKRKYTFQQTTAKKIAAATATSVSDTEVKRTDDTHGPYYGNSVSNGLHLSRPLHCKKDTDTDSSSGKGRWGHHRVYESTVDNDDDQHRTSISHDDTEGGDSMVAKTSRIEKKETVKRIPKDAKECSMNDVPGRHLLGSNMLSFMRAFPEGDVIGNDDVETASTQRVRMEGWLQVMKMGGIQGSKGDTKVDTKGDNLGETSTVGVFDIYTEEEVMAMKSELLDGIELKLVKAAHGPIRGAGHSSIVVKPGMVHFLSPYEVRLSTILSF